MDEKTKAALEQLHLSDAERPIGLSVEEAETVVRALNGHYLHSPQCIQNTWGLARRIEVEAMNIRNVGRLNDDGY